MILRTVLINLILGTFAAALWGQQAETAKTPDFPVVLQQSVTAGKTPVGTKIQAKLWIATLFDRMVVPRNAVFSGEVVESMAKTATDPSRLAIRLDSAQWKNGSTTMKVYFDGRFYPMVADSGQDLQYAPSQPANRTWNGQGQYPDQNSHVYKPFPGGDNGKDSSSPDESSSTLAKSSVMLKGVEVQRDSDGTITLTSKHSNIKLARYTTYVVSTGDQITQQK